MHVQANTNLNLWLLTGRAEGFVSEHLNTAVAYPTASPTSTVVAARKFLRLDQTNTDFYVLGAMAAAYASMPSLRELPDDNLAVFCRDLLRMPTPAVTGATLSPVDGVSWPSMVNHPRTTQAFTRLTFTRKGDQVLIRSDGDVDLLSDFSLTPNGVFIEKALELGVRAVFDVGGVWQEGSVIIVDVPPSRYPYAAFSDELNENGELLKFMSQAGTMEAFASSTNPVFKVGALAAAIMLESFRKTLAVFVADTEESATYAEVSLASRAFYENHQLAVDWLPVNYERAAVTYDEP